MARAERGGDAVTTDRLASATDLPADARRAALLLARDAGLRGIVLRARAGSQRDAWLAAYRAVLPAGHLIRRLPVGIDDDRLTGGIDLAATLAAGRPVVVAGLFDETAAGTIVVPMAERIDAALAGRLAAAMDAGGPRFVFLDEGEGDEAVPAALADRVALWLTLSEGAAAELATPDDRGEELAGVDLAEAVIATAGQLGVASLRLAGLALRTARASAGAGGVAEIDLAAAVRLVLLPRATHLPTDESPAEDAPEPSASEAPAEGEDLAQAGALADRLVAAAAATLPPDLLADLRSDRASARAAAGTGSARPSPLRGRPLPSRPGPRRAAARLAVVDTLRAAVPWQRLRTHRAGLRIAVRGSDFRWRRFAERTGRTTVIAVDASGSAAAARLAEAKGAAEVLLARAYVDRAEVAIVAFRGDSASLIVPPTRSLTRARRALADLCGGGGTPLAAGLDLAAAVIAGVRTRGRQPALVVLTDGRANIARAGTAVRATATADALATARALAAQRVAAVVVDTSARPRREGAELAAALGARYLPLPAAGAGAAASAVSALLPA